MLCQQRLENPARAAGGVGKRAFSEISGGAAVLFFKWFRDFSMVYFP